MSVRRMLVTAVGAVSFSAACGDGLREAGEDPAFTERDSAGVTIVENGNPTIAPAALRETLRIGFMDGPPEYQFVRLRDVAIDQDGTIYALDLGTADVRVYDADGTHLRTCGRSGQGPGEFRSPNRLWLLGDTLVVSDLDPARLTRLTKHCDVIATQSMRGSNRDQLLPLGAVPGAWLAIPLRWSTAFNYQPGVEQRDTTLVLRVTSFGDALESMQSSGDVPLAGRPGIGGIVVRMIGGRRVGVRGTMPSPDGTTQSLLTVATPLFEPSPNRAIDGLGHLHYTSGKTYEIETYDSDGRLLRRLRRAYEPVPISESLIDRFRDAQRSYWDTVTMRGESGLAKANDEARSSMPTVASLPPISQLLASREGALWVRRADLLDDPLELEWRRPPPPRRGTIWDRFDPEGRYLGSVAVDASLTPLVVGQDWVVGILRDSLDVQYLARFEVVRDLTTRDGESGDW